MPKLASIVEGPGDVAALPVILKKIIAGQPQYRQWQILKPIMTQGCGNMLQRNGIERFILLAQKEPGCGAILVVIDGDAINKISSEEDCSPALAYWLARRIRSISPAVPVAVVVARWEFEAWFLASLETIAGSKKGGLSGLPATARYSGAVEECRSPKDWLNQRLPHQHRYLETRDQARLANLLDPELAQQRSRSFRRLGHALEEILVSPRQPLVLVTPSDSVILDR